MERFDIVVCARNSERTIGDCLERIVRYVFPRRLIVIDGQSSDRTLEIASKFGAEVHSDGGLGLGFARNMALHLADTSLLGFVDADVLIPHNWRHLLIHLKHSGVAAASATTIYGYDSLPLRRLHEWMASTMSEDASFTGTVIRREPVIEVGGIREDLQTYEDWELSARLHAHGFRWVWDRRVVNLHCSTLSSYLARVSRWGKGARKSGTLGRTQLVRTTVVAPFLGLKLALTVHPIHAFYWPTVRLAFLMGYLNRSETTGYCDQVSAEKIM
jgi:glycosyltransferase involved in cell wall biosynthesis